MFSCLQLALIWILVVIHRRGVTDAQLQLRLDHQRLYFVQNSLNVMNGRPIMLQHVFDAAVTDCLIVLIGTLFDDIRVQYGCQNVEPECYEGILLWERNADSEVTIGVWRFNRSLHLHNVRVQLFSMVDGVPYIVFFVSWSQQVDEVELI